MIYNPRPGFEGLAERLAFLGRGAVVASYTAVLDPMKLLALLLAGVAHAQTQRIVCPVTADNWVDAPPFSRPANSPANQNHGAEPQLVINGRNSFALLQFEVGKLRGLRVSRATLRVHQAGDQVPLTMVGLSTISGSSAWTERDSNYYEAAAGAGWSYAGSDLTDVTFGPGGSLYAYRSARAVGNGWFEIEVPAALVAALVSGDQFGWMLSDEKGQTRTRHALSSREGPHPPELVIEGERGAETPPGRARSHKNGQQSTIAEARALGRTTLAPGSAILHLGGAGGGTARYEVRYSRQPITAANFTGAAPVPRWCLDPLAPKPSPLAIENSLRDEVHAVVEDLEPGGLYYFAARAISASGTAGPVSALGVYKAFARSFPSLPALDSPAGRRCRAAGRPAHLGGSGSAQDQPENGSAPGKIRGLGLSPPEQYLERRYIDGQAERRSKRIRGFSACGRESCCFTRDPGRGRSEIRRGCSAAGFPAGRRAPMLSRMVRSRR
jgi:hypothetical protein